MIDQKSQEIKVLNEGGTLQKLYSMNIFLDSIFDLGPFIIYLFTIFALLQYWFILRFDENKKTKTFKANQNPSLFYRKQHVQANGKATEAGVIFDNYFAIFIIMVIDWFSGFASLIIFMVLHFLVDFGKVTTDFFEEKKG